MNVIGIDLGGTKINCALVSQEGKILERYHLLSEASKGQTVVIEKIVSCVNKLLEKNKADAVGIGVPGPIENGIVYTAPNLPGWKEVNIKKILEDKLGIPVFVENDANVFLLGEHKFGCAKGFPNVVALTLGTGVGGAILSEGKLMKGVSGNAGELGHMVVEANGFSCHCGNKGCLEQYASGSGIVNIAQDLVKKGEHSTMDEISSEELFNCSRKADPFCMKVIDKMAFYLGVGLSNIVNIFNPELIVIGGGVVHDWDLLSQKATEVMLQKALHHPGEKVKVEKSSLEEDASLLGAAALCF